MATTQIARPTAVELWAVITKEITGIQLLWETVNGLYFQAQGKQWWDLKDGAPLLVHLTQTALMESLLIRVSRMLDPDATGKFSNLSLKQLVKSEPSIGNDEVNLRAVWDGSDLKTVRDKYLSHNDLSRSMTVNHTLNVPLEPKDIEALRQLTDGLRTLRRNVHPKLAAGNAYLDEGLNVKVKHEVDVLGKSLLGGMLFFDLLPEQPALQDAWAESPWVLRRL